MRSLSSALSTALGTPVQQTALLVQVDFSTPQRWSSFATVSWGGQTWTKEAIAVDNLVVEALHVSGTVTVGNGDDVIGALVLSEGVSDKRIRVWGYDAAATATGDIVLLCDAVGASAVIGTTEVRIELRSPSDYVIAPRTFVGAGAGFSTLLPAGTVLKINGINYTLGGR